MGAVEEDFTELIKTMSSGVPAKVKSEDASLEQYRTHN